MTHCYKIRPASEADKADILALHEEAFGPGRFSRTAYRIREQAVTARQIALTARYDDRLIGAIQLTAITIGGKSGAMLLGPLAIAPAFKNMGCGIKLMKQGLEQAGADGFALIVLVGDLPYYQRVGFERVPAGRIVLPGPADPARLLSLALADGALEQYSGLVAADNR